MEESHLPYVDRMGGDDLRELMETYGQEVWNLAYLLTKRRDLADDIAQDVFLRAYGAIASFRGESSVRTWLLSIARNVSINYLKTAFMRKVIPASRIKTKTTAPSAESEALRRSFADEIWEAVLSLPVKLREVLILHARYELGMREIAEMLGLSEGTVKSRLSRARRRMSAILKEEGLAYE